jgi:hypothetical protein
MGHGENDEEKRRGRAIGLRGLSHGLWRESRSGGGRSGCREDANTAPARCSMSSRRSGHGRERTREGRQGSEIVCIRFQTERGG